ncbi:unnamed protein product [Meganyctiphanes norvegica]|uniref:CUB domain-containing protein n=1 Tax=Meganyctiphanes norvegica TaxID=48144 RepID=A0AAV2R6U8_MEGNR
MYKCYFLILLLKWIILPMSVTGASRDCSENFQRDSGSLEYPNSGRYKNNADCTWVIVSSGDRIELNFTRFSTESNHDFLRIRDGGNRHSHQLGEYSGGNLPPTLRTTQNKAFIRFTSDHSQKGDGFALTWVTLNTVEKQCECGGNYSAESGTSCLPLTNGNYRNNMNCVWIISSAVPLDISFSSFHTEGNNDYLTVRDGRDIESPELEKISGIKLPKTLKTKSDAYIQFTSDQNKVKPGFVLHWNISPPEIHSECGGNFNSSSGSIKYPARGTNHDDADCAWVIIVSSGDRLELKFTSFSTDSVYDNVDIRDGEYIGSPRIGRIGVFSGVSLPDPPTLKTTTNKAFIHYTSNHAGTKPGFSLTWNTVEKESNCGEEFRAESGTIRHPIIYGNLYKNDQNCIWIIYSTVPLEIYFSKLNTQSNKDFLTIRDGSTIGSTQLGRFSGYTKPETQTTKGDAYIHFTSNWESAGTGFVLHWNISSSGGNNECGGHFNDDSGSIQYPATGSLYPANANCSWVIVSSGANIELKFTSIDTEPGTDFVYIRDGENISSPELGKYSGLILPSSVTTTSNKAYIHFTSDALYPSKGFVLTWNTVESSTAPIIIGSLTSIIFIVVIIIVVAYCFKKRKNKDKQDVSLVNLPSQQSGPGMGTRHDSENSLYGAMPGTTEPQVPNRGSRHDSENNLYGATVTRDA